MKTYKVTEKYDGQRIDQVLAELIDGYSRSYVQKMIGGKLVKINGKIAKKGNRIHTGDEVTVKEAKLEESRFIPKDIPLDIIYEDEDLLIVNKPPGLLVHPTTREREDTLVNALIHHCGKRLSGIGGERRPGIVHRLDKNTSGIMVVAKHDGSHKDLARKIQRREVEKHYLTLVNGIMDTKEGSVDAPLLKTQVRGKNKVIISPSTVAKNALTHFKVRETFDERYSLLDVQIITGRMHQIRVHLAAIHHPVLGDETYGNHKANAAFKKLGLNRQFLHAYRLKFKHPRTNKWVEFEVPLTEDLQAVLASLRSEV